MLSARIMPVRRREDWPRVELIANVADAFGRLHGSVLRFVALLARLDTQAPLPDALHVPRFDALLASLPAHAEQAGFRRLFALNRLVERAAAAEGYRDVIFSQSPPASDAMLRDAARALEQLDAELVGLCVEHVMECHPQQKPPRLPALIQRHRSPARA